MKNKDSNYVPQAYPQIANALETLAGNIPAEINLPLEKGYALATDLNLLALAGLICCGVTVIGIVSDIVGKILNNDILKEIGYWGMRIGGLCSAIIGFRGYIKTVRLGR